jgi:hypothetical protein
MSFVPEMKYLYYKMIILYIAVNIVSAEKFHGKFL